MKVRLLTSHSFSFDPTSNDKKRFPMTATLAIPKNNEQDQKEIVTNRLKKLMAIFPSKEWTLTAEFKFYDEESLKLDIALEGELLVHLHDILYYGSNNDRLQLLLTTNVSFSFPNTSTLVAEIKAKDMKVDLDTNAEKHFRYCQKQISLPAAWLKENAWKTLSNVSWKINVELEVNDLIDLTSLLTIFSVKVARILDEKLFCDFEIISSDQITIPCHKALLSVSSSMFMAKCEGKLKEPSRNQMTMDITADSVNALLEFIYCSDVRKPITDSCIALELFQAGHEYGIENLENVIAAIFLQKSHHWYDIDVALQLFQFLVNYEGEPSVKLKRKVIKVLAMKSGELEECDLFREIFKTPVERQMFALMAAEVKTEQLM